MSSDYQCRHVYTASCSFYTANSMHHLYSTWVVGLEIEDKQLWVWNQSFSPVPVTYCVAERCTRFDTHLAYLNAHTKLPVCSVHSSNANSCRARLLMKVEEFVLTQSLDAAKYWQGFILFRPACQHQWGAAKQHKRLSAWCNATIIFFISSYFHDADFKRIALP